MIGAVDLFPSLCAIGNVTPPKEADFNGENLSAALLGKQAVKRRRPFFWEYGRNEESFAYPQGKDRSPNVAVRDGKWKLLINGNGSGAELFDLDKDAVEENNLSKKETAVVKRLSRVALDWRKALP